jgi:hypothetical protein
MPSRASRRSPRHVATSESRDGIEDRASRQHPGAPRRCRWRIAGVLAGIESGHGIAPLGQGRRDGEGRRPRGACRDAWPARPAGPSPAQRTMKLDHRRSSPFADLQAGTDERSARSGCRCADVSWIELPASSTGTITRPASCSNKVEAPRPPKSTACRSSLVAVPANPAAGAACRLTRPSTSGRSALHSGIRRGLPLAAACPPAPTTGALTPR